MPKPLTDAELLELLERKSPEQLTVAEIHWLRQRLQQSESLRQSLRDRRQMETYLSAALARIHVTPEMVLARASSKRVSAERKWMLGGGAVIVAILLVSIAVIGARRSARPTAHSGNDAKSALESTGVETIPTPPAAGADDVPQPIDGVEAKPLIEPNDTVIESNEGDRESGSAIVEGSPAPIQAGPDRVVEAVRVPWFEAISDPRLPPAFSEVCFDTFDLMRTLPRRDVLERWFEPVAGSSSTIVDARTTAGQCSAIDGTFRLRAPLAGDRALRVGMEAFHRLQVHFWQGQQGVMLIYHEDDAWRWSAYRVDRDMGAIVPKSARLLATDDGRARRTGLRSGGPLEFRLNEGQMVLSRGDVVLIRVPMPDAPTEVLFSGKATFYGITLVASGAPPVLQDEPVSSKTLRPAEWIWSDSPCPQTQLDRLEDGSVRFTADSTSQRGWRMAPFQCEVPAEIVLRIRRATAGAGLFLGKDGERPGQSLRFLTDKRNGGLAVAVRGDEDASEENFPAIAEHFVPVTDGNAWLRLVVGAGVARCWISHDGVIWAELEQTLPVPVGYNQIGLHHVAMSAACQLQLVSIEVRELSTVRSLVDPSYLLQAKPVLQATTREAWQQQVDATRPGDREPTDWQRATALRTVAAGCTRTIGEPLLLDLLSDRSTLQWEPKRQMAFIRELSLLFDLRNNHALVPLVVDRYYQIGHAALDSGLEDPFTRIRNSLMTTELDSKASFPLADSQLIRGELLALLYHERWHSAVEFCRQVRYFHQHENVPLLDWAENLARREAAASDKLAQRSMALGPSVARPTVRNRSELAVRPKIGWQHPYVEELNKDTYNALGELRTVVESGSYLEAARMIAGLSRDLATGVAPASDDERLLTTLPIAVRILTRTHPELAAAISREFQEIAQLRVREAITAGDVAAAQAVVSQFESTNAAAEARQWLGDRALTAGQFELALSEYEQAALVMSTAPQSLLGKMRLAGAMLGIDLGESVTSPVTIGNRQWSPAEFEEMLADLRKARLDADRNINVATSSTDVISGGMRSELRLQPLLKVREYAPQIRSVVDGPMGESPAEEIMRGVHRYKVDCVGRQLAVLVEGPRLYVANRFQLAAYDATSGQRLWQAAPSGLKSLRTREWTNAPMRPVAQGNTVFVRMLYGDGPILTAVDTAKGEVSWTSAEWKGHWVISDPVTRYDRVDAITLQRLDSQEIQVRLTSFDLETGDIVADRDLIRLNQIWNARHVCEVAASEQGLLIALGGILLAVDREGAVEWVRRQLVLPVDEEPELATQFHDRPTLHGKLAYTAQPGVRAIECVERDTGKLKWSTMLGDIRRLVGVHSGVVLVQVDSGFRGLDAETGQLVWSYRAAELLTCSVLESGSNPEGQFVFAQAMPIDSGKRFRPRLVWLEVATGREQGSISLSALDDENPQWGPLVTRAPRIWTFFGRGPHDPRRELVELVPN